jgi:hypothetical protein
MAEVTGRIGDADVALDNAATEATLRALLLATVGSKAEYKKLMAMASKTLDPRKVEAANQALAQNALANNQTSTASSGIVKGFSLLGAVLGDITAKAFQTVGNLADFAGSLISGKASISGLFAAFKDLPLGLGVVAGLFEKLALFQQENLSAFRDLTKVGINLSGDLLQVRAQALEAGLTMQEYGEVISANAETIAALGNSADQGAAAFRKINSKLVTGDLANQLLSLGYGFRDINELTVSYIKINGGLTASQLKNTGQVQQAVINYAKELDVLSRLTGKSREQLQKQQEEQAADLNFQSYLNGLDEESRAKANSVLQLAMESGGKGAADALKAKLMGLPPLTEEAQMYYATMQSGRQSIEDFYNVVNNGKTLQQSQNALDKIFSQAVSGNIRDLKQFRTVLAAGGMTGDKFSSALQGVQAAVQTYMKRGMTEELAIQKTLDAQRRKQFTQGQSTAAAAAEAERALKDLGSILMAGLLPAFEALAPMLFELAQHFTKFATENAPQFGIMMNNLVRAVSDFIKNLFSPEGRDKILTDMSEMLAKLLQMVWDRFSLFSFDSAQTQAERTQYLADSAKKRQVPNLQAILPMKASGGITNQPSIFGEAGWEAAVPLPDGRTIPVTLQIPDQMKDLKMDVASSTNNDSKDLLEELQLLNKNIATLITHSKTNVDINRSNLDALKGLNGNLFA